MKTVIAIGFALFAVAMVPSTMAAVTSCYMGTETSSSQQACSTQTSDTSYFCTKTLIDASLFGVKTAVYGCAADVRSEAIALISSKFLFSFVSAVHRISPNDCVSILLRRKQLQWCHVGLPEFSSSSSSSHCSIDDDSLKH